MILVLFAERRTRDVVQLAVDLSAAVARAAAQPVTCFGPRAEMPELPVGVVAEDVLSLSAQALADRLTARGRGKGAVFAIVTGRTEQTVASLDVADVVLLSSDLTVPSLRRLQRTAQFCESLGIARRRTGVVLLTTGDEPVSAGEARTFLKRDPLAIIPAGQGRPAAIRALVARLLPR